MHPNVYHLSSAKLYNLVRCAKPSEATPETRCGLEELSEGYSTGAEHHIRGIRFKVSMLEEVLAFNQGLTMDLM